MSAYVRSFIHTPAHADDDERPEDILEALFDDYEERGPEAIDDLRRRNPAHFIMAVGALMNDDRCPNATRVSIA